ncbi:MAG TPA: pantetheine-phosphate adenylyltransferase [Elusimicrobiota bacterium]|nr:pantetheine-phosphate adenylyltransferase [Elusimicrobiota bacterium]
MSRVAVYPGSFDPVTRGHLDVIERACQLFDHVIVAVSANLAKQHTFSIAERMEMLEECLRDNPRADVDTFSGLLVDYLRAKNARVLIRGVRTVGDMDYEFQMAAMNRKLYPETETIFLMPDDRYTYLSSSIVKEAYRLGARIDDFLPPPASRRLRAKFKPKRR